MKFKKNTFFLFITLFLATQLYSCARFRIEELKPVLVAFAPLVSDSVDTDLALAAPVTIQGRLPANLPATPAFAEGRLYMVDTLHRRVRVFAGESGELEKIIAPGKEESPENVEWIVSPIGIPGDITVSSSGVIYLQSWPDDEVESEALQGLPPAERLPGELNVKSLRPEASHILELNEKWKPIHRIGVDGNDSAPFEYVYSLHSDKNGQLFVFHNRGTERVLSIFLKGKLVRRFENLQIPVPEADARKYRVVVEEMIPESSSEKSILASVAFRSRKDYTPEFRKIYRVMPDGKMEELLHLDEEGDYLASSGPEGRFYLMNTEGEGDRVLFRIYSSTGEYLNNRLIVFPGARSSWQNTFLTPEGNILSVRLGDKRYEIYEWK